MNRLIALLLLLITLPFIVLISLVIKLNYPGPIFYKQKREGKDGKPFYIIKLRTMVSNAAILLKEMLEKDPVLALSWAETGVLKNDPRIAGRFGKLARQLSIDELPQLINVVQGEMAFIGPRPLDIPSVEALHPTIRKLRYSVLPGITGLAQVEYRNASIRQMQFYDSLYIKKQSVRLDIYILFKTVLSVFNRTGA